LQVGRAKGPIGTIPPAFGSCQEGKENLLPLHWVERALRYLAVADWRSSRRARRLFNEIARDHE